MVRIFLMGLLLWLGLISPSIAGEITNIKVGKKSPNEIEIIIEGEYTSYQAFGLQSPARFIIDLEGTKLKKGAPEVLKIKGPVVSAIRVGQGNYRLRVVLDSVNKAELFHCTVQDKRGMLVAKCWMPVKAKVIPAAGSKAAQGSDRVSPLLPKKDLAALFGWPKQAGDKGKKKKTKKVATYTGQKITLDFYKTDIHNVFRLLAEISGKNIIVDDKVKGELTLALKEIPWDLALDIILDLKGLTKEEKLNTFIIKPMVEKKGKGELIVRKFSEEILQPAKLLKKEKESRQVARQMIINAHNLETQGMKEEALTLYEKAFGIWKDNIDLIKKTAYLHYILRNFAKSYFFAGQALKLNQKDSEAALYGALSASRMEKPAAASLLFETAINGRPKIPEVFLDYGVFLEKQKDFNKALDIYKRHEGLFGPALNVSLAMARLYEKQQNIREACKKYREIQFSGFDIDRETENIIKQKIQTLCIQGEK